MPHMPLYNIHTNSKRFITKYDDVVNVGEQCKGLLYHIALAALTCQKGINDVPRPSAIGRPEVVRLTVGALLFCHSFIFPRLHKSDLKSQLPGFSESCLGLRIAS